MYPIFNQCRPMFLNILVTTNDILEIQFQVVGMQKNFINKSKDNPLSAIVETL